MTNAVETVALPPVDADVKAGRKLYGNDFTADQLGQWYRDEEHGYYDLGYEATTQSGAFQYGLLNYVEASSLRNRRYGRCLVLGCAEGIELLSLQLDIGEVVAIEPAEDYWKERIGHLPVSFRKPTLDGLIAEPDASFDLVVALSVLHHIANVEQVLGECGRLLRPGGVALIREPLASMGDFTRPRPGLTAHERGIPAELMKRFLANAGLSVERTRFRQMAGLFEIANKIGLDAYNNRAFIWVDRALATIASINNRYWRDDLFSKLAPRWGVYIARKPA